ncbi:MAG: Lrp/AsnC family transcriptional regulator [Candidatus Kariarchaeaceae archaeon]|jgi:DNA-binding Lrp family transcriptional regulator
MDVGEINLDTLDMNLLRELRRDSRQSVRQLAKALGESPSTVYNRVKRLEKNEIIRKFTISFSYDHLNLSTLAFIFVGLKPPAPGDELDIRAMARDIAKITNVCEVHLISGEFDLLVKVRSQSLKTVGQFVIDELRSKPYVHKTSTNACFETILEECETNVD